MDTNTPIPSTTTSPPADLLMDDDILDAAKLDTELEKLEQQNTQPANLVMKLQNNHNNTGGDDLEEDSDAYIVSLGYTSLTMATNTDTLLGSTLYYLLTFKLM
jgi:hypothetical protein